MEHLKNECSKCGNPKTTTLSLRASCAECGLDSREITYLVPPERMDDFIHEISALFASHSLQPANDAVEILSYEELLARLDI
jgi:hypothetical protein